MDEAFGCGALLSVGSENNYQGNEKILTDSDVGGGVHGRLFL